MSNKTEQTTVLMLAGGDSTRMWPFSDKYNIYFAGYTLIDIAFQKLIRHGFKKVVVVTNKLNDGFINGRIKYYPQLIVTTQIQFDPNDMAGAILSAEQYIRNSSLLIVSPADIIEDSAYMDLKRLLDGNPDGVIPGVTMDTYFPGGYITVSGNTVTGIVEKPGPKKRPSNIVNFVFDYFRESSDLLTALRKADSGKNVLMPYEKALDFLIKSGSVFKFLPYKGYWGYMKYPWHILSLMDYFLDRLSDTRGKNVFLAKSANISGKVVLSDNVQILENAKIVGPAYIGRGTVIGNNSLVIRSMLGNHSVVGFNTEITRSFIGDECWFHSNYIGDSVMGNNISFGAGSVLANYRLNESEISSVVEKETINTGRIKFGSVIGNKVRIGVNTSVMPGIKIGNNTLVGAGVVLDKDLRDNTYCKHKPQQYGITVNKIKENEQYKKRKPDLLKLS